MGFDIIKINLVYITESVSILVRLKFQNRLESVSVRIGLRWIGLSLKYRYTDMHTGRHKERHTDRHNDWHTVNWQAYRYISDRHTDKDTIRITDRNTRHTYIYDKHPPEATFH